jgi:NAD(P)-dependent dehydrogenase (short-subunit alcohol dehydrogenase family)
MKTMKTEDAVVLVTGANRGLGRALVLEAIAGGARRVYATARDLEQVQDLARQARNRVVPLQLDITDPAQLAAAAARAGDVTLLINNAGVLASGRVIESGPAEIARDFAVNVFGTLSASRAFLPALERAGAAGGAAIVNVLSVASLSSLPVLGGYSAAKAAALSLTQALRAELGRKGIRVHAALPGGIDTDMVRTMDIPKSTPALVARGILDGVEAGLDEILPDPMARDLFAVWKRDPKELEKQFASMSAG